MKPIILGAAALALLVAACGSPRTAEDRYIIIRDTTPDRALPLGAEEYCRQRGGSLVVVEEETGNDRITFYCR